MDIIEILQRILSGKIVFCSPSLSEQEDPVPPGIRLHKHPRREILLPLEGENDFYLQNRNLRLTPGTAVLIDSWVPHSFGYTEGDHDLLHLWIFFVNSQINCRFCRVGMNGRYHFIGAKSFPPYLYPLINSRWNELKKQECGADGMAERYLLSPLHCLLEEITIRHDQPDRTAPSGSDLVSSMKLYIETQNARECSLENLEKVFGYSRFYLAHKFREIQGKTLGEYINEVRRAFTEDARQKGLKQKEIAYELGFSSSSAFWKWLRNQQKTKRNRSDAD